MKADTRQDTNSQGKRGGQRLRGGAGDGADRADRTDADHGAEAQTGGEGVRANNTPLSLTMYRDVGICGGSGLSMDERLKLEKRLLELRVQDPEKKDPAAGVTTPVDSVGVSAGVTTPDSAPEKKDPADELNRIASRPCVGIPIGSHGCTATASVLAMAKVLKMRPAVLIKAAEANRAWRDERGVLIISDEALPGLSKKLEMKLRVVQEAARMAMAVKLEDGEEYVRVVSIPANNKLLGCVRLCSDHNGEHVTVKVRDTLNYKMGEEFIARANRNGMEAVYGK